MHQYRLPAVKATYPPAEMDQPSTSDVEGELIPYAHRDIKPA
jgi:serine/threonine kinase 16